MCQALNHITDGLGSPETRAIGHSIAEFPEDSNMEVALIRQPPAEMHQTARGQGRAQGLITTVDHFSYSSAKIRSMSLSAKRIQPSEAFLPTLLGLSVLWRP